jgi:hypothetical protein
MLLFPKGIRGSSGLLFWCVRNTIALVFSMFTIRLLLVNRVWAASITEFNFVEEALTFLPVNNILVSSAYKTTLASGMFCGRSLINNENNIGPRIEPWGTPMPMLRVEDVILPCFKLFSSTYCFLLVKYDYP